MFLEKIFFKVKNQFGNSASRFLSNLMVFDLAGSININTMSGSYLDTSGV